MNNVPIEAALSHARGASQFSGDGAVMHCLADEIERLRTCQAPVARAYADRYLDASTGVTWVYGNLGWQEFP